MADKSRLTRFIPLEDEVKNHVFQWAADAFYNTLPKNIKVSLNQLMNEIKINEHLKKYGGPVDEKAPGGNATNIFISIFKSKYLELCDMNYTRPIDVVDRVNINRTIEDITNNCGEYQRFLEWVFDDFFTLEENKRFMPPSLNFICKPFLREKYLYLMKDEIKLRKRDMDMQAVRNMLLEIALPLAERANSKDFSQKLIDFSQQKITPTKFFTVMKAFASKVNDSIAVAACERIDQSKIKS